MKTDKTYNGWPNYDTWNVMLWMDNDEPAYRLYRDLVRHVKANGCYFNGANARYACEQAFGTGTPDRVCFSSTKIRWGKIAEAMRAN